jgi:glycosyltransferase involved in cell wall biosynthesis
MPSRPILFDVTRLLTRLGHAAPTGIDRVDLAYLRHLLDGRAGRDAVSIVGSAARILPPAKLAQISRTLDERWGEQGPADRDAGLAAIRAWLAGGARPATPAPKRGGGRRATLARFAQRRWFEAGSWRWPTAPDSAPRDAVYVHTSHLRLDRPELFAWLGARPDVKPVFFVHDVIPIDFPEYGVPGEDARHLVRMETIARHAAAVLTNSADVAARFRDLVGRRGWRVPPVAVAPLGVEEPFLGPVRRAVGGRPYLVVCSTIEARKNHLLLLQVWRELAAAGGEVPALVIVGRRGWESEAAADLLDRCPSLRDHVLEVSGLSTPALSELVAGARALLMPSFAEGYGIPVVEALAVGTPVVASDIPVFREIAGDRAELIHPLDGPGWLAAVRRLGAPGAGRTAPARPFAPPTWAAHFAVVDELLASL